MKKFLKAAIITSISAGMVFAGVTASSAEDVALNQEQIDKTVKAIDFSKKTYESVLVIVTKDKIEQVSVNDSEKTLEEVFNDRGLKLSDFTDEDENALSPKMVLENKQTYVIYNKSISGNSETIVLPFESRTTNDSLYYVGEEFKEVNGENGSALKTTITSTRRDASSIDHAFIESSQTQINVVKKPVTELFKVGTRECDTKFSCELASGEQKRLSNGLGHPLGGAHNWTTYGEGNTDSHGHGAIDVPMPSGTSIYAVADGVVVESAFVASGGNQVTIKHDDGNATTYAHMLSLPIVKEGDIVSKGQKIGEVGSTGNSTGPHLHFEIRDQTTEWGPWIPVASYYSAYDVDLGFCISGPCSIAAR